MLALTPSVQSPRAYDLANLATAEQIMARVYAQTAAESSASAAISKYRPRIVPDIERYGCDTADSAAVNTPLLQKAINANYGRVLIVPPGTFEVETAGSTTAPVGNALSITGAITIVFQGIVKAGNNCNVFNIAAGAQDVVTFIYEGGGIQGHGTFYETTNYNGSLVRITAGILRAYQIQLIDAPQYAVYASGVNEGVLSEVEIIGGPDSYIGDNHYGICLVDAAHDWQLRGIKTLANAAGGKVSQAIASLTFTTGEADRTSVNGSRLLNQWEKGTYLFGADLQVNDNWIFNCENGEGVRVIGARPQVCVNKIRNCVSGGITLYDGQDALCIANDISGYEGGHGVQLGYYSTVAGKSISRAKIEANKIRGDGVAGLAGIAVLGHASSNTVEEGISIQRNECHSVNYDTTDERAGIHIQPLDNATMTHLHICDNIVNKSGSYGLRFGAGVYTYAKVEGNRILDPGMQAATLGSGRSGIRWDTSITWVGSHINGNLALSGDASSVMTYGFENVTLASITSCSVHGNVSRGHTTNSYLNMNNDSNDLFNNRAGDNGLTGTFTMDAAASKVITNGNAQAHARVDFYPTNAAAAALMNGTKRLYFDGTVTAGTNWTVKTADGAAAAGTETFAYRLNI